MLLHTLTHLRYLLNYEKKVKIERRRTCSHGQSQRKVMHRTVFICVTHTYSVEYICQIEKLPKKVLSPLFYILL